MATSAATTLRRWLSAVLLIFVAGRSGLAAAPPELLHNCGFEEGATASAAWSENAWGQPGPSFAYASGAEPHSGRRCQQVTLTALPPGSGFIYRQPFTFAGGHTYRGRVWLRSPAGLRVQVVLRRAGQWYEPCAARQVQLDATWREVVLAGGFGEGDVPGFFGISLPSPGTVQIDDASLQDISDEALRLPPPAEPVTRAFYGLHLNKLGSHNVWPALGQGTLRLWDTGTTWDALEPTPGEWHWSRLDYYVQHALSHDPACRLILTLGIPPTWASAPGARAAYGGRAAAPTDLATWRRYVRAVGERYRGRIRYWEPWNECDYGGFFQGGPAAMLPLARAAWEELKALDPANVVLSPNVTRAGLGWLDEYLAAGGGQWCDVVSFHRYPSARPEQDVPEYFAFRDLLAAHGLAAKPLWNTEGAIDHRSPDPAAAVGAVARAWLVQWCQGITGFNWYCWDIHWPEGTQLSTTLTGAEPSPAGRGLAQLVQWTGGATIVSREVQARVWQMTLRRGGEVTHLVWREEGTAAWAVPVGWGPVRATTLSGAEVAVTAGELPLGPEPVRLAPADRP